MTKCIYDHGLIEECGLKRALVGSQQSVRDDRCSWSSSLGQAKPLDSFAPPLKIRTMHPMYLYEVEHHPPPEPYATRFRMMREAGLPIPQIQHLFAFKPDRTDHLSRFTQEVMRGPSPLPPWQRELIAAFTSKLNQCLF